MTTQEQIEFLKQTKKCLVTAYLDVRYKLNDIEFTERIKECLVRLDISVHELGEVRTDAATQIAVQFMKGRPTAPAEQVSEFVKQVMTTIKSV